MTPVDVFFAASTAGAWVLPATGLFAAAWAIARIASWTWRLIRAAVRWRRDTADTQTIRRLGDQIDAAPLHQTQPAPIDETYLQLEALYRADAYSREGEQQ